MRGFVTGACDAAWRIARRRFADQTPAHLQALRESELKLVRSLLPASGRLLEIGAGAGWQARALAAAGYEVSAIDLPASNYRDARIWPVTDYDGVTLPFAPATFDIVFSSNVLEHIPHVRAFQSEIRRVLRPGGLAVHVLPSASWRAWTSVAHIVKCLDIPRLHGEIAGNALTEQFQFSRVWWRRLFRATGWAIERIVPNGLFYTGHSLLDAHLPLDERRLWSRRLGSACHVYVLRDRSATPLSGDAA